ncbi:hypothetical protein [Spirillospora sp. NPDC047279]|uniref:hypothetical protein n=1 Tax=Spirillospora sp. NPDC047279 TaxID=3155478 RepID=UPI0033D40E80
MIFLAALVVGCGSGGLMFWATGSVPSALLAGLGATGGAIGLFNRIIETEPKPATDERE